MKKQQNQEDEEPRPKKSVGMGSVSVKIRKALDCKQGEVAQKQKKIVSDIEKVLKKNIPHTVSWNRKANTMTLIHAAAEHLAGETTDFVEEKYKLSQSSVEKALKMFFPSREAREAALENILLSNGITASMIFAEKAQELTARDAALTAGIFTQRYSELRRARQTNHAPEIPVNLVLNLEATLSKIKSVHGKTIDI